MDTPSSSAARSSELNIQNEAVETARRKGLELVSRGVEEEAIGRGLARVFREKQAERLKENKRRIVDINWLREISGDQIRRSQIRAFEIFKEEMKLPDAPNFSLETELNLVVPLEGGITLGLTLPKMTESGPAPRVPVLKKMRLPSILGPEDHPKFQEIVGRFKEEGLVFRYGLIDDFLEIHNPNHQ